LAWLIDHCSVGTRKENTRHTGKIEKTDQKTQNPFLVIRSSGDSDEQDGSGKIGATWKSLMDKPFLIKLIG